MTRFELRTLLFALFTLAPLAPGSFAHAQTYDADVEGLGSEPAPAHEGAHETTERPAAARYEAPRTYEPATPSYPREPEGDLAMLRAAGVDAVFMPDVSEVYAPGAQTIVGERGDDFELDVTAALELIAAQRPSVTFLTSPNNPTGIVESESTIRTVLGAVADVGGLLVVDEAYGQFAPWSATALLDDDTPLVVTRTYSKTWAMGGARLGYLLGPAWLMDELDKVVLPYHLDSMKQAAGLAALEFIDDMEAMVASVVEERGRIVARLQDLGADVWPSGANFVLFRPPSGDGAAVWQGLLDRSVLVRNTSGWDRLEGCLRVTVGTPADNARFLNAIAEVLGAPSGAETPS